MAESKKETSAERIARILAASEDELDAEFEPTQGRGGAVNVAGPGSVVGIQSAGSVNNVVIVNGKRVS